MLEVLDLLRFCVCVCVCLAGVVRFSGGHTASNITIWLKAKLNTSEGRKITTTLFHLIILMLVYIGVRFSHGGLCHLGFSEEQLLW